MGATVWAQPEFQAAHPSFVLAPQVPLSTSNNWVLPNIRDTVYGFVLGLIAQYPIDPDRVYVQGLSLGSFGTSAQLTAHPECTQAPSSSPEPCRSPRDRRCRCLPGWPRPSMTISTRRPWRYANAYIAAGVSVAQAAWPGNLFEAAAPFAEALIEVAEAQGSHVLFTTYQTGTNVGAAHNTGWIATYSNPAIREWLFSQKRP